jgi:hypothetical protein
LVLGTTGWFGVRAPSPTKPVRREKRNPAERTANALRQPSAAVTDSAAAAGEDFLRGIYQRHARRFEHSCSPLSAQIDTGPKTSSRRRSSAPGIAATLSRVFGRSRCAPGCSPSPGGFSSTSIALELSGQRSPVGEIFEDGSTVDDTEGLVWSMAIREALLSLSPAHRQTLVETLFRQRTVSEAAETLGISPGTVKSRAYYGLRALRSALEEMDKLPA